MFSRLLTCAASKAKNVHLPKQVPVKSVKLALAQGSCTSLQLFSQQRGYAKKPSHKGIREEVHAVRAPANTNVPMQEATITEPVMRVPLFIEREIDWIEEHGKPPRKLLFRVTYKGIGDYYPIKSVMWNIEGKEIPAPFFNCEDVLLEMLEAQYQNTEPGSKKPTYSIQMMSPGSGKTRILAEWIMQAFANPSVISNFLKDNGRQSRKSFLNALYWSAYKQHTLISRGVNWKPKSKTQTSMVTATINVIRDTILLRHHGQSINFNGQLIHITSASAKRYFGLEKEISLLIGLFTSLADITYESPVSLPFPEAGLPPIKSFVFFSIDECQAMSENFQGEDKEDAVYKLFRDIAAPTADLIGQGIVPFWFAVGTNLPGRFFNLEGQQTYFYLIASSLGNLLNIKYLAKICEEFFAAKLPKQYYKSESNLPELPEEAAKAIVRNYLKTFGNPRAVEMFVVTAMDFINEAVPASGSGHQVTRMNQLDRALGKRLDFVFPNVTIDGAAEDVERLDIAAALCSEMNYDNMVPGLNVSPKQLSTRGYLSIWKREAVNGLVKFYMTRPFFKLDHSKLLQDLKMLQCKKEVANSQYWKPEPISLSSLVLEKDCADYLSSPNVKGESFEIAVASSLYARYKLAQKEYVLFKDIFPAKDMPAALMEATLTRQVNAKSHDVFAEIQRNQVITIDICNSKFADVLVPVIINGVQSIVAFQCEQYAGKPPLPKLIANCMVVHERGFYYVAINPVQHLTAEFHTGLAAVDPNMAESYKARAFLVKAEELVSPLYLVGMAFVPHEFTKTS